MRMALMLSVVLVMATAGAAYACTSHSLVHAETIDGLLDKLKDAGLLDDGDVQVGFYDHHFFLTDKDGNVEGPHYTGAGDYLSPHETAVINFINAQINTKNETDSRLDETTGSESETFNESATFSG